MSEPTELELEPGDVCPLSGIVVTAIPHEDWIEERPYRCHVCGAETTYRIRNTDLPGHARLHTHRVPGEESDDWWRAMAP